MTTFDTISEQVGDNSSVKQGKVHFLDAGEPNEPKEGFRIKKAANKAFKILASIALGLGFAAGATAAVLTFTATSTVALPIATTVAIVCAVVLAVLLTLKVWEKISPHLPNSLRLTGNYIQSAVLGLASAVALGIIFPIDCAKSNPKPEEIDPKQPLRLAIHGFLGSSSNWIYHLYRFKEAGLKNFASINLGNWCHSIDDYADKVHKMVVQYKKGMVQAKLIKEEDTLHVQFVCHSMGGLVARHYNQKYAKKDGVIVDDICTLGTPLNRTKVAVFAWWSKAGREMFEKEFTDNQRRRAATENEETRHYYIASKCDYVIRPLTSATDGNTPKKRTKVYWLDATGHVSYLFSDKAADKLIAYLKKRNQENG
ncbi:MAG: hypothetical protein AAGG81_01580 [Chlamydiota bacterium]